MIRVAIVDDEIEFARRVQEITRQYFESRKIEYEAVVYQIPQELLWDIGEGQYFDIYLIDIEMPDVSGMELAHAIRQKYDEPYIIFVTAHMEYSIQGYEYNVWRYIIKDEMAEKLPLAFDSLQQRLAGKVQKMYSIEMHAKLFRIAYQDIYYLHKEGKYTNFYTSTGMYRERSSLNQVYESLNDNAFIFTDRAYIANIRHVMSFQDHMAIMRDGTEIPVSIPQFQKVKKAISEYWRENR